MIQTTSTHPLHPALRCLCLPLAFTGSLLLGAVGSARAWSPPIGIPAPSFGITEVAPTPPNPWSAPIANFYYVDESASGATDSSNPYGTPARPRRTIPLSLPAGALVVLHGDYTMGHMSPRIIVSNGTASNPVFIHGDKARALRGWQLRGSYYIVENISFAAPSPSFSGQLGVYLIAPTEHGVLRNNDVSGSLRSGSVQVYGVSASNGVTNAVLYKNVVHDNGDVGSAEDQDVHSISIGGFVNTLWVLENQVSRSSGSGIVVNAGSRTNQPYTHHIYIGRNTVSETRQSGIFSKQSVDTIISQNLVHDIINTNWSPSKGLGYQYGPDRIWFLFNHVYNCRFGIFGGSDSGMGSGQNQYAIGNLIHDIHHVGSYRPNTAWSEAAIMLAGGTNRSLINNTIWNADAGINVPGRGTVVVVNNIIGAPQMAEGNHVFFEGGGNGLVLQHNLFQGGVRIRLGSKTFTDLADLQTAGQVQKNLNADPHFAGSETYRLAVVSPAVDAGFAHEVYRAFFERYGHSIAFDMDGAPRPQSRAPAIGAYEPSPSR